MYWQGPPLLRTYLAQTCFSKVLPFLQLDVVSTVSEGLVAQGLQNLWRKCTSVTQHNAQYTCLLKSWAAGRA